MSLRSLCFEPLFLDICSVKQILTMITRIKLLWKSYSVCSDINEWYEIRQGSFTSVLEVFFIASNLGASGFNNRIFLTFEQILEGELFPEDNPSDFRHFHKSLGFLTFSFSFQR